MRHRNDATSPTDLVAVTSEADRLDRAWDILTAPAPRDAIDAAPVPDQLAALRRLQALATNYDTAGARERIRRRLFATSQGERVAMTTIAASSTTEGSNGASAVPAGTIQSPRHHLSRNRRRVARHLSPTLQYVASIFLLAGLIGAYFATANSLPDHFGFQGGTTPGAERTFAEWTGASAGVVLPSSAEPLTLTLRRLTFAPGVEWDDAAAPRMVTALSGRILVRYGTPVESLTIGPTGFVGTHEPLLLRNDSSEDAIVLDLIATTSDRDVAPPNGVKVEILAMGRTDSPPVGEASLGIRLGTINSESSTYGVDAGTQGLAVVAATGREGIELLGSHGEVSVDASAAIAAPYRVAVDGGHSAFASNGASFLLVGTDAPVLLGVLDSNPAGDSTTPPLAYEDAGVVASTQIDESALLIRRRS